MIKSVTAINYNRRNSPSFKSTNNIENVLDNKAFSFKKQNGSIFHGTIRNYLKSSIIRYNPIYDKTFYHCTHTKAQAHKMVQNGLDWTKTARMKCGPGTYFTPSRYGGSEFSSGNVAICGTYVGNKQDYPIFEPCFYEAITDNKELQNNYRKVNEYCHKILQDEMGIDFLYASAGRATGAFVVINNDCMELTLC